MPGAGGSQEFLVRASYLEIYNEEIRDLLSKNPQARLDLKEHPERGVYVKDLMQFVVKSAAEISSVLQVSHSLAWIESSVPALDIGNSRLASLKEEHPGNRGS